MKLNSKARYAVMALADLAKSNAKEPTSLTEISLRQGISIDYLEQPGIYGSRGLGALGKPFGLFCSI